MYILRYPAKVQIIDRNRNCSIDNSRMLESKKGSLTYGFWVQITSLR